MRINKIIFAFVGVGICWLLFLVLGKQPQELEYSDYAFEHLLRNSATKIPPDSVVSIRIYRYSESGFWSEKILQRRSEAQKIITDRTAIKKIVTELSYPGDRNLRNLSRFKELFHIIIETKNDGVAYARLKSDGRIWYVIGNRTLYEIFPPQSEELQLRE